MDVFATFAVTFYAAKLLLFLRLENMLSIQLLETVLVDPRLNNWAMFYDKLLIHYLFFIGLAGTPLLLHGFLLVLALHMIYRELLKGKKKRLLEARIKETKRLCNSRGRTNY